MIDISIERSLFLVLAIAPAACVGETEAQPSPVVGVAIPGLGYGLEADPIADDNPMFHNADHGVVLSARISAVEA